MSPAAARPIADAREGSVERFPTAEAAAAEDSRAPHRQKQAASLIFDDSSDGIAPCAARIKMSPDDGTICVVLEGL